MWRKTVACRGTGGLVPISSAQLYSVACALYFLFYSKIIQ